jgi:hypothetical protein
MDPGSAGGGLLMERELGATLVIVVFYATLIIGVVAVAAKGRNLVAHQDVEIGALDALRPVNGLPSIDVLRVGAGAIVTVRDDIGENIARDAHQIVGDMIEDGVARFILEVEGEGTVSAPLLDLLREVAEASAVARVHLSLVIPDGEAAESVTGSTFGRDVPIFLTSANAGHDRH